MGKKWFLIGGAAVIIVAIALYGGLVIYPQAQFRTALREAQQLLPPGTSLAYKSADYSLFSDRATLTGVTFRDTGPLHLEGTIDKIEIDRPSLTLGNDWQRAEANPKALTPDTSLPVAATFSYTRIVIRTQKMREIIDTARIDGLRLHPWALLHPGVPSPAAVQASLSTKPPPTSLAAFVPLLRFEAALALGVGYTAASAEDITGTARIPKTPQLPAHVVTFTIAKSDATGNDRGVLSSGTAGHIVMNLGAPAGTLTIERVAMTGLNARQPLEKLLDAAALTPPILNGLGIGRIELGGMAIKPPSRPAVRLGTFTLSRIAVSHGLPVSAALAWDGLHLTRAEMLTPKARLAFDQLGLDTMTVNFGAAYNWELAAGRVAVQDIRLKVAELGSLSLSASLVGVTPGPDALDRARLADAELQYRDASLVGRALNAAAATMHADPAAFRQQLIAMVQGRVGEFADSPALAEAAKAIVTFLNAPHSLTVELSPPSPVPLATLRNTATMTPPALASLVGLHVTANQ